MAPTKASEKLPTQKFVDAIAYLDDITTIHTNPNLTRLRANLIHGSSDGGISDNMVQALEVFGIAKAVATHFCSTP